MKGGRTSVLAYHGVGDCPGGARQHQCVCIPPDVFAAHMTFLARRRRVVPLRDLVEGSTETTTRPAVAITFDDGYENVLTTAAPLLERHGFPATVFVPSGWIGSTNGWDAGTPCFPLRLMDEAQLREAEERGIAVESHGHDHIDFESSEPAAVAGDLDRAVDRLTTVLGRSPRYLAYPYGRHSQAVRSLVEAAGFDAAFLFNEAGTGPYALERVSMDGYEGRLRLRLKTAGGYLERRRSRAGHAAASVVRRVVRRPVYE